MKLREAIKRANSTFRYWNYRRTETTVHMTFTWACREWVRRLCFELRHNQQRRNCRMSFEGNYYEACKRIGELGAELQRVYETNAVNAELLRKEQERTGQLAGAIRHYCAQSTIGSPYGVDGLKGATAHHQMYREYFERALDGSQFSPQSDAGVKP
jgi:hypothetical protein